MKKLLLLVALMAIGNLVSAQKQDNRYFEMRIYYCEPGRLPNLLTRFRDHTTKIFERHGMTNIGYWVPTQNEKNALYYVLAYPSKEARDASWKAFGADPEWKKVSEESQRDGKIVAKVESIFMMRPIFRQKSKKK